MNGFGTVNHLDKVHCGRIGGILSPKNCHSLQATFSLLQQCSVQVRLALERWDPQVFKSKKHSWVNVAGGIGSNCKF